MAEQNENIENVQNLDQQNQGIEKPANDTKAKATKAKAKVQVNKPKPETKPKTEVSEPKTKTDQRDRIALDVFGKNPKSKQLHFTSDMIPFFDESDANKHASTLDDDTVVTVNKE